MLGGGFRMRCPAPPETSLEQKMSTYTSGQHEHGQNFLCDNQIVFQFVDLVRRETTGPIIEIGPGKGALTVPLLHLGRPVTGVEIDSHWVRYLRKRHKQLAVVQADFLRYRLPAVPHVIVGNVPFHLTTAILRKLLHSPKWTSAVLIVQWEVARRRAGVGSSTMMTAQWAPWFEFGLGVRVPAAAFRPCPIIDGGILYIHRRLYPLIPIAEQQNFQQIVHAVFSGKGRGFLEICMRCGLFKSKRVAARWVQKYKVNPAALPSKLTLEQWVGLFAETQNKN